MAADTSVPSGVSRGLRLISTGNSPVPAQAVQFQSGAHGSDLAVDEVALPEVGVVTAEPLRDEDLDGPAQEICPSVAEERFCLGVDELDGAAVVNDDHRVGGGFQECPEQLFSGLSFAHIAYGRGDEQAVGGLQGTEADLDGELAPVPAQAVQLQARPHGPDLTAGRVPEPVVRVEPPETLGYQDVDGPAEQLLPRVTEQRLRLGVHQPDHTRVVHDHHRVRCRFQQGSEGFLGRCRHVVPRTRRTPPKPTSDHALTRHHAR